MISSTLHFKLKPINYFQADGRALFIRIKFGKVIFFWSRDQVLVKKLFWSLEKFWSRNFFWSLDQVLVKKLFWSLEKFWSRNFFWSLDQNLVKKLYFRPENKTSRLEETSLKHQLGRFWTLLKQCFVYYFINTFWTLLKQCFVCL